MKNLIKMLIGGVVGAGIILLFFYVLGMFVTFIESHLWVLIPMFIIAIVVILKI